MPTKELPKKTPPTKAKKPAAKTAPKAPAKKTPQTGTDWTPIRLAYIHSGKSLAQVAADFRVTADAAEQRSAREGWAELRRQASEAVSTAAAARMEAERVSELVAWNAADLAAAKALRARVLHCLDAQPEEGDEPIGPNQVRALVAAAEGVQRIGRLALGATTENTGLSNPEGGPIEGANVPVGDYEEALRRVMSEVIAPGSLAA